MWRLGFVFCALALAASVSAQSTDDPAVNGLSIPAAPDVIARDGQGQITLRTTRLPSALDFDGKLDESFYRDVPSFGDFVQQEPHEGQPATDRTEVWVFYDDTNLYVSARLWESEPGHRLSTEMRRDANNLYNNDHFGIVFDSFYDRHNGYGFAINPQGGMLDWSITNEQPNNNWNGIWDVRTGEFEHGWTLEVRYPFRSFRFREDGHIWGMNFRRRVAFKNEVSFLVPVLASWGRPALSKMSVAAAMGNLQVPGKMRNIDLKPYALGSVLSDRNALPPRSNDPDGNIGFDVKWGIRQTLIADFTVNTDFAQVEDDQSAGEPDAVQPAVSGETRFFPRRRRHVQFRRAARLAPAAPAEAAAPRAAARTRARRRCSSIAGASASATASRCRFRPVDACWAAPAPGDSAP